MRNILDQSSDGTINNFKESQINRKHKIFLYTAILTYVLTGAVALVDIVINNYKTGEEVALSIYKTWIPTTITFLATIILKNIVTSTDKKFLHANTIGLIVLPLVPLFYVVTLTNGSLIPIFVTGILGGIATILSVLAHIESPD